MSGFIMDIERLESASINNLELSNSEKILAKEYETLAKQELKKAQARETLSKRQLDIAKTKQKLAEKTRKFIEDKEKVQEILTLSESGLKIEKENAQYTELLAIAQIEIAEIHKKIANIEKDLAEAKLTLAQDKMNLANIRFKLSSMQSNYIKLKVKGKSEDKLKKVEADFKNQEQDLVNSQIKVSQKVKEINKIENTIADLKKKLGSKLLERERIRPRMLN